MKTKFYVCSIFLLLLTSSSLFATHNAAGEILYRQIGNNTVEATVITYTNANSTAADRDSVFICWGDGICDRIVRTNGPIGGPNGVPQGELITPDIKKNLYVSTHVYSGQDSYIISMTDPNRTGGILNVNFPASDNVSFHIQSTFNQFNTVFQGFDRSPILLEPPVDVAFTNAVYTHIPNGYDPDGDSLTYELITPMSQLNAEVPNYQYPNDVEPGSDNELTINEQTGEITWNMPQILGLYVIAIKIRSYREGQFIGEVIRDMLIEVEEGLGIPPLIEVGNVADPSQITAVALGDTVRFSVQYSDENLEEDVELTSTSGLYDFFDNPAGFTVQSNGNSGTAEFEWIVREEHLRQQPYAVVVKAKDNHSPNGYASYVLLRYRTNFVVSNAPDPLAGMELKAFPNPSQNFIDLSVDPKWVKTYRVLDTKGQSLQTGIIENQQTRIPTLHLPAGTYFIQVFSEKGTSRTLSFVKQ